MASGLACVPRRPRRFRDVSLATGQSLELDIDAQ